MCFIKKITTTFFLILLFSQTLFSQNGGHSTFYYQRESLFEKLPTSEDDIIFLGNSITNGGEWVELLNDKRIKNRGISGDVCAGVINRLSTITDGNPDKIFIMIGINDLARGTSPDSIVSMTGKIIDIIESESPKSTIYIQSILPVNESFGMFSGHTEHKETIKPLNCRLECLATKKGAKYIDLYSHFVISGTQSLDPKYTNDGLHLMGDGYIKWAELIKPYIYD